MRQAEQADFRTYRRKPVLTQRKKAGRPKSRISRSDYVLVVWRTMFDNMVQEATRAQFSELDTMNIKNDGFRSGVKLGTILARIEFDKFAKAALKDRKHLLRGKIDLSKFKDEEALLWLMYDELLPQTDLLRKAEDLLHLQASAKDVFPNIYDWTVAELSFIPNDTVRKARRKLPKQFTRKEVISLNRHVKEQNGLYAEDAAKLFGISKQRLMDLLVECQRQRKPIKTQQHKGKLLLIPPK